MRLLSCVLLLMSLFSLSIFAESNAASHDVKLVVANYAYVDIAQKQSSFEFTYSSVTTSGARRSLSVQKSTITPTAIASANISGPASELVSDIASDIINNGKLMNVTDTNAETVCFTLIDRF